MARLADLPPELLLHILQFIPLPSLLRVSALSHEWRRFFIEHESTIFRNAAIKHNFARPEVIHVDEARRAYAAKFLRDVQDWKTFCKQLYLLFQSWAGRGPVEIKALTECSFNVHRIKVDEEAGIVLTTHTTGGLRVTDLETDKLLWALPETYVRSWAHCEYQNGFLIFDRFGEYKEIWRLTMVDEESPPEPPPGRQDQVQIQLGEGTARIARIIRSRLYFRPWALLSTPEWGQAFRFVYPFLLVASLTKAYVYDVVSAILVQTIEDTQNVNDPTNVQLGDINYVELNDKYVFICGSIELRIYSRSNGQVVLRLPPQSLNSVKRVQLDLRGYRPQWMYYSPITSPVTIRSPVSPYTQSSLFIHIEFIGVHVHKQEFVALLSDNRLVLVRNFEESIKRGRPLPESMLVIDLNVDSNGHPGNSVYLAFEHGHVGVVSTSGVFVFTTDASYHSIPGSTDNTAELARSPFPSLLACRAIPFDDEVNLGRVSCLQMTDSRLFLTYDPNITRRFSKQRELDTCSTAATMTSTEAVSPTSASASEPIAWENTEYMNAEEQPMPIMHTNATEAAHDEGEPPDVIPLGDIHVELADADGDEDEDVQAGDDEEEEEEEEDSDNDDIFHHFNQPDPKDFSPNNEYMYRV